ncbi:hypothetical protein F6X40_11395 [Paraburkholderia sp. UCT31]|uniref:hypothetical protein n=1 Tax=Paraburkholderia sp. UCT31 TaxID=2615209 RepID=UPI001655887C|nr:hypothetical protein [Paraburkholderia sp. UCT31]MBC8737409.1 hypothetical protein [Paraburkholderia sp. UCT31]
MFNSMEASSENSGYETMAHGGGLSARLPKGYAGSSVPSNWAVGTAFALFMLAAAMRSALADDFSSQFGMQMLCVCYWVFVSPRRFLLCMQGSIVCNLLFPVVAFFIGRDVAVSTSGTLLAVLNVALIVSGVIKVAALPSDRA